jgi:hypothetical protein
LTVLLVETNKIKPENPVINAARKIAKESASLYIRETGAHPSINRLSIRSIRPDI